jgi:hypothetical protein
VKRLMDRILDRTFEAVFDPFEPIEAAKDEVKVWIGFIAGLIIVLWMPYKKQRDDGQWMRGK